MTIKEIQQFLNANGYTDSKGNKLVEDGKDGPLTQSAVKKYQTILNVAIDGKWGPKTEAAHQLKINPPNNDTTGGDTTGGDNTGGDTTKKDIPSKSTDPFNPNTGVAKELERTMPTTYYDYTERSKELEKPVVMQTDAFADLAASTDYIDDNFVKNNILGKPDVLGFYVNAVLYGGYSYGDVVSDMKRREMIFNKDPKAVAMKPIISDTMDKHTYIATADGKQSIKDTASIIAPFPLPTAIDSDILQWGSNMPDAVFEELVPVLDKDSQEFKDAVANVKQAFSYLTDAQIKATSEQEKAVADSNYNEFKKQINEQYGIALSDDASKAWAQIEGLENSFAKQGIAGSGLQNEAVDDVLQETRKQDQRLRQEKLTKEEAQKAAFYTSSATPAQIAALTQEEREKWGLAPSKDLLDSLSDAALKEKFPDLSAQERADYRNTILDENGNYRSTIYAKKYKDINDNKISSKAKAETEVLETAQDKELETYSNYDKTQPYSATTAEGAAGVEEQGKLNGEEETDPNAEGLKPKNEAPVVTPPAVNTVSTSPTFSGVNLKLGSKGADVTTLQNQLIQAGFGNLVGTADGNFGPKTQAALIAYQKANGLTADGIAGKNTFAKLNPTNSTNTTNTQTQNNTVTSTPPKLIPFTSADAFNPNTGQANPNYKAPVVTTPKVTTPVVTTPKVTTPAVTTPKTPAPGTATFGDKGQYTYKVDKNGVPYGNPL